MCLVPMKIKSRSPSGLKYSFVPCGKCAECRASYKNAWFFRLAVELQECQKLNWHIGFFTLTYNDEHLPYFTSESGESVKCFRRSDVRRLILRLRKQYHREFDVTKMVYLIASEFGEHTQRPHYHGIICFPPCIAPSRMLSDIKRYWSDENMDSLGFIFPSLEQYAEQKFIVTSAYASAMYASKYCCKDISFNDVISCLSDSDLKSDAWKDCKQFHIQSKSLGSRLLSDLSDDDKIKLLREGLQLVGSPRALSVPLYIKNKILYDPLYMTDSEGNRVVARVASSFLRSHAREVYDMKLKFYEGFFAKWKSSDYWSSLGLDASIISKAVDASCYLFNRFGTMQRCAMYYLSYFGVDIANRSGDCVQSWLNRYFVCSELVRDYEFVFNDTDKLFSCLFGLHNLKNREVAYEKMLKINGVQEYFKNLSNGV